MANSKVKSSSTSATSLVDSGISWLGQIPKGWGVKRLKYVARMNQRVLPEDTDPDYQMKYVDIGNVESGGAIGEPSEYRFADAPSRARRVIAPNDTIIATVRTYLKAIAFFEKPESNTVVSTGFAVLSAKEQLSPKYLYYHSISESSVQHVMANSFGVSYPAITPTALGSLPVLLPPIADQQKIAAHLDEKTAVIDSAVEKKRRLVGLLKEKRAALINQAVTKGLDPKAQLVDSGVEWIRKIPKGWEVTNLGQIGTFYKGGLISKKELTDDGVPVLLYGDIYTKYDIKTDAFERRTSVEAAAGSPKTMRGDLLFTGSGETEEDIGKCIVYLGKDSAYVGGDVMIFKQESADSLFLSYQQNSSPIRAEKASGARGQIIVHISPTQLKNVHAVLPPLPDQQKIATYLDEKTSAIDEAIVKINQSIDLLVEYKSSLITGVVTGKVKV